MDKRVEHLRLEILRHELARLLLEGRDWFDDEVQRICRLIFVQAQLIYEWQGMIL